MLSFEMTPCVRQHHYDWTAPFTSRLTQTAQKLNFQPFCMIFKHRLILTSGYQYENTKSPKLIATCVDKYIT